MTPLDQAIRSMALAIRDAHYSEQAQFCGSAQYDPPDDFWLFVELRKQVAEYIAKCKHGPDAGVIRNRLCNIIEDAVTALRAINHHKP